MDTRTPFAQTEAIQKYRHISTLPAAALLDDVRSMYNVGAFFRTADAVRLEKLYLTGITAFPPKKEITKTALGAEQHVAWEHSWDPVQIVDRLEMQGVELVAIETSTRSVDIFDWQPRWPVCVLFGNEVEGVKPYLAARCATHVRLPMLGHKHSLNVASTAAVVLYEMLRKYRGGERQGMNMPPGGKASC